MSKKAKLSLNDLEVHSFVTTFNKLQENIIKGGNESSDDGSNDSHCPTLDGTVVVTHDASCHTFCDSCG